MVNLQEYIHKLEEGPYLRHLRITLLCLALLGLWVGYDWLCYRNMASPEAMDAAQVARNLTQGEGYTTDFVRPLSIHFVKDRNQKRFGPTPIGPESDYARVKGRHPDLANPPLYPLVLAGWMKVYPLGLRAMDAVRGVMPKFVQKRLPVFNASLSSPHWALEGRFARHPEDRKSVV